MRLYELFNESAGGVGSAAVATSIGDGNKPKSQVGTFFGGTYKQKKPKTRESVNSNATEKNNERSN